MSAHRCYWSAGLHWFGVAMTVACVTFIAARNMSWSEQLVNDLGFQPSWLFAGMAVVAALAAELCSTAHDTGDAERNPAALPADFKETPASEVPMARSAPPSESAMYLS